MHDRKSYVGQNVHLLFVISQLIKTYSDFYCTLKRSMLNASRKNDEVIAYNRLAITNLSPICIVHIFKKQNKI